MVTGMKIAIISDVHGNKPALDAVLAAARDAEVAAIWNLGDSSDWLPDSAAVLDTLRSHVDINIAGNHDHAVTGQLTQEQMDDFSDIALSSIAATRQDLTDRPDLHDWLASLPSSMIVSAHEQDFMLVHGAPQDTVWAYLDHKDAAKHAFWLMDEHIQLGFNGHTHIPFAWHQRADKNGGYLADPRQRDPDLITDRRIDLNANDRYLICPGSVGLPRKRHASQGIELRAQWGLLDLAEASFTWMHTTYDIDLVLARIDAFDVSDDAKWALREQFGLRRPKRDRQRRRRQS